MSTILLRIGGMTCGACSARVEKALRNTPGVESCAVNLTTGIATVNTQASAAKDLVDAVENIGFDASEIAAGGQTQAIKDVGEQARKNLHAAGQRLWIGIIFGLPVFIIEMLHHLHMMSGFTGMHWLLLALTTVVMAVTGRPYFVHGIRNALQLAPNMDTLVALGAGTAYVASAGYIVAGYHMTDFHAAVTIVVLVTLGKYLEARAKAAANTGVADLANQTSPTAWIVDQHNNAHQVDAAAVRPGDRVRILAHEHAPVDGELAGGSGSINLAVITGESAPVELNHKELGPRSIPAGALLLDGMIEMTAAASAADSTISRILSYVQNAQASKTQIQRLADQVAAIFTPIVLALGVITLLIWIFTGHSFAVALGPAIATIVIACPCAMGLATPTAITVATARAARMGILFRNAAVLETARTIDTVLFDKTGTLTTGQFAVTDVVPIQDHAVAPQDRIDLLTLVASLEQYSQHPLAQAIVRRIKEEELPLSPVEDFQSVAGGGVGGVVNGRRIMAGSERFLASRNVTVSENLRQALPAGTSQIWIADESVGAVLGYVALADQAKPEAREVVATLQRHGVNVVMVSGDNKVAVATQASALGIADYHAEVRPEDKAAIVESYHANLQTNKTGTTHRVAFVGDGVNDAPALAKADLGIAFANATDLARSSADITLLGGTISAIPQTILLAKTTLRVIRQNLVWAFGYNVIAIPLAMAGVLSPGVAAAAMVMSSVSVVLNALRLYRVPLH